MTSLDVSSNAIGRIDIFPDGWRSKDNDGRAPFVGDKMQSPTVPLGDKMQYHDADGWRQDAVPDGAKSSGVIALTNAIPDMGALTSLNMSANGLKGTEAGKALGDAIAASVLKELNISGGKYNGQKCDVEFVQTISVGLRDNGALSVLNLASNNIGGYYAAAYEGQALMNQAFTATPEGTCI
jgi:hypothetical protein